MNDKTRSNNTNSMPIFDRYMVEGGKCLSPSELSDLGKYNTTVAFVRSDGWSLAANKETQQQAYELWEDEWVYFYDVEVNQFRKIEYYGD